MVQKQQDLIKLASPDIRNDDINKAIEVIKSGNLVEGVYVQEFEKNLSEFTGIEYTTVVSSATAGLHLTLKTLNIKSTDYVIVPTFTFPATANVVEDIGANVIFCDVGIDTYVIDPISLENTIAKHQDKEIKAIIVVHEFGYPAEMKKISELAKKYNLKLIEDAACALGTIADNYHVGYYSDAAVFSFHPRKAITSGEGGAIVSKNKELIENIKVLKNHGIFRDENGIDFIAAGLNYRMTDFQAAMLAGQLDRFKLELKKRKELVKLYYDELSNVDAIGLPQDNIGHSWQSFMIVLDKKVDRSEVIVKLLENNVQANLGAQALPMLSYYKHKYNIDETFYFNSKILFQQGLVLPLYGKLNTKDIKYIAYNIKKLF